MMRAVGWVVAVVFFVIAVGIQIVGPLPEQLVVSSYAGIGSGFSLGFPTMLSGGTTGPQTVSYAGVADDGQLAVFVVETELLGGFSVTGAHPGVLPPSSIKNPACGAVFDKALEEDAPVPVSIAPSSSYCTAQVVVATTKALYVVTVVSGEGPGAAQAVAESFQPVS